MITLHLDFINSVLHTVELETTARTLEAKLFNSAKHYLRSN
jgi:hypothetical protein